MFYEYRVTYYTRLKTMNNNIISTIMYFERLFFLLSCESDPLGYAKTKYSNVLNPNGRDSFTLQRRRLGAETLL